MEHKLPELPYAYNALEPYIDERTMKIHHTKHHQAYINNLNLALEKYPKLFKFDVHSLISNLPRLPGNIRNAVRNSGGGHSNHSLFWKIMRPAQRASRPEGLLKKVLSNNFGSFDSFREKFSQTALARFGSGWAWLSVTGSELVIEDTENQDSPLSRKRIPILGLDVWEHAYYLKYQNRRADYIEAWWNIVNRDQVEINLRSALK